MSAMQALMAGWLQDRILCARIPHNAHLCGLGESGTRLRLDLFLTPWRKSSEKSDKSDSYSEADSYSEVESFDDWLLKRRECSGSRKRERRGTLKEEKRRIGFRPRGMRFGRSSKESLLLDDIPSIGAGVWP